jgi:holo-[acyl-carrier protein] synthase
VISGIGIDVVQVSRMRHWVDDPGLLERFFHPLEIRTAMERGEAAVLSLAARFAAKEAFGKALGTGLRGISLKEIRISNNGLGKPDVALTGTAREAFERSGGRRILCSLTHEVDNAIAMIVIEGDPDE